ncbi:MAG: hypothetical protein PHP66_06180 [Syntrophales bacterium]|jgi:hypothetical protein|nr:hypothetical protein [Syntrophales bacterium]
MGNAYYFFEIRLADQAKQGAPAATLSAKISANGGENMGAQIHQMTPLLPEGAEDPHQKIIAYVSNS